MPKSVRFRGSNIVRPGVVTYHNLDGLLNADLSSEASVLIIGEATAGQPQADAANPVVHTFKSSDSMIDTFVDGNLAECAKFLFDPAMSGQYARGGVPIRGCDTVYAIKTNLSVQSSRTLQDGAAHNALTIKDRLWGIIGDQTWFKIEASGTGIQLTTGRDVEPNVGSQASILFSITGTDEWLSVFYTGAALTATMTFDGTTFTTTTAGGVDDISVVATNRTMTEFVSLINATAGAGGGTYTAVVLRADRANVLATYMDRFAGVDIKPPALGKAMGVSYDIVAWVNASCDYCEATWVAGYEPQVYAKTYLTGGALGDSSTGRITDALKVAARLNVRHIVSGWSGASVGGAVALSVINGYFNTHATNCNRLGSTKERHVYISSSDTTKAALYVTVGAFNNEYMCCGNNRLYREGPDNTKKWMGPHTFAAAVAAMCSGSPRATPMLWKKINACDFDFLATDFDPADDTDFYDAVNKGVIFLEADNDDGGIRIAKGITTYNSEDNDGRTMLETVHARMWHKIILRRYQKRQIGMKSAGVLTADEILDITKDAHRVMADASDPDFLLVAGTDEDGNAVPAYYGLTCASSGGAFYVSGNVHFTTGVTWIFNDIAGRLPTSFVE